MRNDEVSFEVVANIGILAEYATGWKKEVNIVAWNGGAPKLDIRDWDPGHEHMSRGITLSADETQRLFEAVRARDAVGMLQGMAKPARKNDYER